MVYYSKHKKRKSNNRRMLIFAIFALSFYFAFNLGSSKTEGNLQYCNSELNKSQKSMDILQADKVNLQKIIEKLNIEQSLLEEKYNEAIPSEEAQDLFNSINAKVHAGIDLSRIVRVVDDLKTDRKCSSPVNKRFIVKTPLYKGEISNTNVSFENKIFEITADGYSFINEDKRPESWFDVSKSISMIFNTANGTEVVKQELPINKSIILDDKEYFFIVEESDSRGFVNISQHHCNYP